MNLFALPIKTEGVSNTTIRKYSSLSIPTNSMIPKDKRLMLQILCHFCLNVENMELKQNIESEVITKNGKDYLHVKSVRVHMKLAKLQINFDSRTGSKEVNDEINKVVNQQWRDIYKEIKPDLEQNIAEVIKSMIGPLFDNIPYQDFFL